MIYPTAGVHILSLPFFADRLFEYYIPKEFLDSVKPGSLVVVPFGGSNKRMNGVVFALSEKEQVADLKPIESVSDEVTLTDEERKLCLFMKEHLFCSVSDAVRQIVPPEALARITVSYRANPPDPDRTPVSKNALIVYTEVLQAGELSTARLLAKFGEGTDKIVQKLCQYGYLEKVSKTDGKSNRVIEEIVYLTIPEEDYDKILPTIRGTVQSALIRHLKQEGSAPYEILKDRLGVTRKQLDALGKKGYIALEKRDLFRNPYADFQAEDAGPTELSPDQQEAFDQIAGLIDSGQAKAALLHGVTGSGKTMVIKAAIDRVIAKGRQAILLVPEIALTPQTVSVFCASYKDRVAVLHSSLSRGERYDAWRKIRSGEIDLCIGTRSAVFAPFANLGLIVIDEEHEHTYKSDQSPRYHARDIARFRCAYHGALMLLSSATPSVESYYKAESGAYSLIELHQRYGQAKLPETVICDLRLDARQGRLSTVGTILRDAMDRTLKKDEQSILFVNRRGYNNYLSCPLCGNVVTCPHCSVSLTYHKNRSEKEGCLICHYCGYRTPLPQKCPECGSDSFNFMGFGTQKAEDDIAAEFPDAKIMRMDADTASAKFSVDRMLSSFRNGEADVLIGTQMVTKGHNFPDVTLVGVLLADNSLYLSDYRAFERTFALITQVIGRAGRGDKPGIAVIQTYSPDHPVLLLAAQQNYKEFYQNEIAIRKSLVFPPFCDIALIGLSAADEGLLNNTALSFAARIKELADGEFKDVQIVVFGPFEAPVYKLNESYRMRFIVKCRSNQRTRSLFRTLLDEFTKKAGKKVTLTVDINPSNL